jgi:hypothetical protein
MANKAKPKREVKKPKKAKEPFMSPGLPATKKAKGAHVERNAADKVGRSGRMKMPRSWDSPGGPM